ncbi:hypothetical protein P7K49_002511 [Saguinus oedipus]|uniref:Uncharacterized protein n=1 Tax=Saguinus oedipus TaxID=9490 RepID=A0ABQ9WI39_SAGOE|nr:hypothetical protein P7K49_002511 [Saguinus oedipus]
MDPWFPRGPSFYHQDSLGFGSLSCSGIAASLSLWALNTISSGQETGPQLASSFSCCGATQLSNLCESGHVQNRAQLKDPSLNGDLQ